MAIIVKKDAILITKRKPIGTNQIHTVPGACDIGLGTIRCIYATTYINTFTSHANRTMSAYIFAYEQKCYVYCLIYAIETNKYIT